MKQFLIRSKNIIIAVIVGVAVALATISVFAASTLMGDLNLDGKVNPVDLAILARHIANWEGYEELPYQETNAPDDEPVTYERKLLSCVNDIAVSDMLSAAKNNNPVAFKSNVNHVLEGTVVTRIGVPVKSVSDPNADCQTAVHLINTQTAPAEIIQTVPLVIKADTFTSATVNEWYYFDVDITIGEGQALAFGTKNDTLIFGYTDKTVTSALEETRGCQVNMDLESPRQFDVSLLFDITYEEADNRTANSLEGKYISILGASTSTYMGYSNCSLYNSTIAANANYYTTAKLADVNDTWWMKTVNELDLRLCVNNSWSGSCITTKVDGNEKAGCMDRTSQLHNDKLGIEPDIIVLIIGGNDALRGYSVGEYNGVGDIYDANTKQYIGDCTLFGQAYATMVHKVKARYENADIYVCSMLHWRENTMVEYNNVIKTIADEFSITYIDLYNGTEISPDTKDTYLFSDGVHPNAAGFAQMSNCIKNVLLSRYN